MKQSYRIRRCRIVLSSSDGVGTMGIVRATGKSEKCVQRRQERFMAEGVDGLLREKSRPSGTPDERTAEVIRLTPSPDRAPGGPRHSHHHIRPIARRPTAAKARPRNADGCGRFADLREDRRQYRSIPGSRPTPGTATGHRRNRPSSHGIPAAPASRTRLSKPSLISPVSPAPCG